MKCRISYFFLKELHDVSYLICSPVMDGPLERSQKSWKTGTFPYKFVNTLPISTKSPAVTLTGIELNPLLNLGRMSRTVFQERSVSLRLPRLPFLPLVL